MKEKDDKIYADWEDIINANIFTFKKGDAIAYIVFYIIIPVIVTVVSLNELKTGGLEKIYCYMTILISSFNAIYDGANRWTNEKTIKNTKIFMILIANAIISVYCFTVIMYILITKNVGFRCDWLFLSYILSIAVALFDSCSCFINEMVLISCMKKGKK